MSSVTRHSLRVFSSVSVLRGEGVDVLDALVPFFVPILQIMNGKVFDPNLFALGVRKMYRWHFTAEVAEHFIPRLERKNYIKKYFDGKDAAFVVTLPPDEDDGGQQGILEVVEQVISEFASFPPRVTDLLSYGRSREELTDILMRFLVSDQFQFGQPDAISDESVTSAALAELADGGRPLADDDRYMAARFVAHIAEDKPALLPHLTRMASIGLLAEVVEDFVRPTTAAENVDLVIAIDAPLALDYLGLSGRAVADDVRAAFKALVSIGCKLVVFPVTCAEMSRNLQTMLRLPITERYGPTHQAMNKREVMKEYVEFVAANPETALQKEGVQLRPIDLTSFPSEQKYFDASRFEDFFEQIRWVQDVKPREHDATCMALLMRLRGGKHSSDILKCRYAFVTRNPAFTRQSRRYCIDSGLLYENQEGPIVHQRELATVAWLRTGLGATSEIPSKQLIAHCDRVLRIRPEVAAAVKRRLANITPESLGQFDLLLLEQRSVRKLADATLNNEHVVTSDNAEHLLSLMKSAAIADKEAEFAEKLTELREEHRRERYAERKTQRQMLEAKERELAELNSSVAALRVEQAGLRKERNELAADVVTYVNKMQRKTRQRVMFFWWIVAGISIISLFIPKQPFWMQAVTVLFAVVSAYYSLADAIDLPKFGLTNVMSWLAERRVRSELKRRGAQFLSPNGFSYEGGIVAPLPDRIQIEQQKEAPVPTELDVGTPSPSSTSSKRSRKARPPQ